MANLNTKYLDYTGLGLFLKQLKGYIGSEIAKIHGNNLYLYDSGKNNPTITSQIEDIWELIGTTDGTKDSLVELISKLQLDLNTETTNRTNGDLALGTRIDNLNERLESVETSYVKNISSTNSAGPTTNTDGSKYVKYVDITTNSKKTGEVTININDGMLSETMNNMANQISALSLGMKLTVSVNPSVVHKNTGYQPEISGTLTNPSSAVIDSMTLKDGNTEYAMTLSSTANKYIYEFPSNISFTANKTYTVTAKALGMDFVGSTTIYARYPVYYGMGTSADDVKSKGAKASARTTAVSNTTYDATAAANGVRFYLLVPYDVTRPSSFTMGGAPVDMTYADVALDHVAYRAYYTVATYNVGGEVKIKAQ